MPEPADLASTNGAVTTSGITRARAIRRRFIIATLMLFVALWTVALIYSVTAGGRSPERLDDQTARVVATACIDAQHTLSTLTQVGVHATAAAQATRIAEEDKVLTKMVDRLRGVHPRQTTPANALTGWLDDWQGLIVAREHYVHDLRTKDTAARFVEPATKGVDPIADKMNNWILEQGTRTDACNTGELQAEVVAGPRIYGPESTS